MFNSNNSTNQGTTGSLRLMRKLHIFAYAFISVLILVVIGWEYHLYNEICDLQEKYTDIQLSSQKSQEANEKVLAKLEEIRNEQIKIEEKHTKIIQLKYEHDTTVTLLKTNGLTPYDDLGANVNLTVDDMNRIIDYYDSKVGTGFSGRGEVFINASKETGLNPIYIFAHAACESAYGKSDFAVTRGNYFGINAVDSNPSAAYHMGNSLDEGIIAGAQWIKRNYYDNGYTTLQSMKDAGYATSDTWVSTITSIANTAIEVM